MSVRQSAKEGKPGRETEIVTQVGRACYTSYERSAMTRSCRTLLRAQWPDETSQARTEKGRD